MYGQQRETYYPEQFDDQDTLYSDCTKPSSLSSSSQSPSPVVIVAHILSVLLYITIILTPPFSKGVYLGETDNYIYGLLGYCEKDGANCRQIDFNNGRYKSVDDDSSDWKITGDKRNCLLMVCFILSIVVLGCSIISLVLNCLCGYTTKKCWRVVVLVSTVFSFALSSVMTGCLIAAFIPDCFWLLWLLIPVDVLLFICVGLNSLDLNSRASNEKIRTTLYRMSHFPA
ncbi:unnamed protein product [Ambrosiozyma monospora]|uniref:Unnamed protein product n=1 Tax=Ambrosiozyma monospora TaxID=43982 RepID=A0ACB5STF9_AMBMO|nr:unnamed protein product [Ambrosiozyma monospora]